MGQSWLTAHQAEQRYRIRYEIILRGISSGQLQAKVYQGRKRRRIWLEEKSLRSWAEFYGLGKFRLDHKPVEHILGYGPLTVDQAASLCSVPKIRIYRLLYTGTLRARKSPQGLWRIDPWSLRDWAVSENLPIPSILRFVATEREMRLAREFFGVAAKAYTYARKHGIPLPEDWTNTLLQQIHNREKENQLDARKLAESQG